MESDMDIVPIPVVAANDDESVNPRIVDAHIRLLNRLRGYDDHVREKRAAWGGIGSVIYFVRRRDLIKIGWSTNLRDRLYHLQVQPYCLLAIEPGDERLERRLHGRFIDALVDGTDLGKEHFRPVPELLDYIDAIRTRAGVPLLVRGEAS